jgi:5-formyltetrahydrofolate cyclo-ligase
MSAQHIRQHFRQLRRSLDLKQQQQSSLQLLRNINDAIGFKYHKKIGCYISTQSEISLNPWIASATRQHVYLPKLYETIQPQLRFAPLNQSTIWMRNRFDILEPDAAWGDTVSAQRLDIVLLPLVAFDRHGSRMGMGGGYYDRSLAFRNHRQHWKKPLLIGVAYSCQESSQLPVNPWDIDMDLIITEKEIITPTPV